MDTFGISLDDLLSDTDVLTALLQYHLVPDARLSTSDLEESRLLPTALEDFSLIGGSLDEIEGFASTAGFIGSPVRVCRSVIYLIDEVLLPQGSIEELRNTFIETPIPVPVVETAVACREGFNAFFAISSDESLSTFADLLNLAQLSRS